jgi:hypothetical protein
VKVLSLQCPFQHRFDGWFADDADFQNQSMRGLLTCPVCGHAEVHKLPSAPRLNLNKSQAFPDQRSEIAATGASSARVHALQQLIQQSDDVGAQFTEEALSMHRGETEFRSIRGQATSEQAQELLEEGVDVFPLLPGWDGGPLH